MVVYYVDWWDEDYGLLRRHFGNVAQARSHFRKVRRSSSGTVTLYKSELKQTKDELIAALNGLTLGEPMDPYPNATTMATSKPSPAMMRTYPPEES